MKTFLTLLALVAIQLTLSNCAYIYSKSDNIPERINKLVLQEQFGLALDTLEYIGPKHSNYVFLMEEKKRITLLASKYEDKTLKLATKQEKTKNWAAANKIYEDALEKLPQSTKIIAAQNNFIIKRDKYLNQLKNKLLVSNAKTLSKKTATTKEIAQVNPNDAKAKNLLRSHIREVELTAEKLITCAEDGIKNKDVALAEECLSLASNLSTTKETNQKIKSLHKKLNAIRKKRTSVHKKSVKTISKKLSQVTTNKELIHYKKEILALHHQDKSNKKILKLKKELEIRINKALKIGIKKGQDLYSQGRIKQALANWKELQQLEPEDAKLNDYIHRAERVLKKLQSLSNNPTPVTLPKKSN